MLGYEFLQFFQVFLGNPCFAVGIVVVCQLPEFLRIGKTDAQVL